MNELTVRFLKIYNYLLDTKKVSNPSDFAKKIGVSTSLMNEILKGRTNAGIIPVQNLVNVFLETNPSWLLIGNGEMILEENRIPIDQRCEEIQALNKEDKERILSTIDALIRDAKNRSSEK